MQPNYVGSSRMFANSFFQNTTPAGYFQPEALRASDELDMDSDLSIGNHLDAFNQHLQRDDVDYD